ncbi:MAG: MFS transporter [Paeniglutamicibacter terrestris]|jgi:MHS family proline/betaine transporter-like MFS transporter|uniref:MFS transporter n=1 Tax=Paeniglutamicibacter terrestris TaxID=2723403 RepID=A0ABX1GAD6_9MICC|nr:MFS transporter [Paeniglutamicibacter terrestris]ASN39534.1 MFS transporter [Arthrobacter sp. 7749]NKG22367.1 MFS transporter [Paeniglutamicibacter terrestris]
MANPQVVTKAQLSAARKAVVSSSIGAALEWFDIIVYATFAVVIAENFYPESNGTFGLVLTFATFALSYVIRPLGGMILGSYADRKGRKNALTLTLMLMMLGTLIMAVAPTYAQVGVWGAVIILISRLIQGFSAGGEFGTATAFLIETAPNKKAYYSSWQVASQGASMLLASAFGYGLTQWLSKEDLYAWGWRVPFFVGLLIGPVGLYIRAKLDETEEFMKAEKEHAPLKVLVVHHYGRLLAGAAVIGVATISVYMILYMPTFAVKNLGIPATAAFLGGVVAGVIVLIGVPFVGHLADRVGPARVMTYAAIGALLLAWPLFQLMVTTPTVPVMVVVIALLGVIMAFYFGPMPALLSSLFPAAIRGTGLAVTYNVGVTLLGGIAPLVLTWLLAITGSLNAPSLYYMAIAVISLVGLYFVRKRYLQP